MQQRSEETRAHILMAAQQLFSKNGYDAAGVAEICAQAGVSKGAFYHHFTSKHALFLQLLENWLAELEPRLAEFTRSSGSAAETFMGMASLVGPIFDAGAGQLPMFLEFWVQASRDPILWAATIAPYQRYLEMFRSVIQTGVDEGSLRRLDAEMGARVVMALSMGLILQGLFDPKGAAWDVTAQQGMRFLMDGMSRRAE